MNCTNFYKWIDQYRLGRINVSDSQRSGQPLLQWKCQCSDGKPKWHAFSRRLKNNCESKSCNLLCTSAGAVHTIIHNKQIYVLQKNMRMLGSQNSWLNITKLTDLRLTGIEKLYEADVDKFLTGLSLVMEHFFIFNCLVLWKKVCEKEIWEQGRY